MSDFNLAQEVRAVIPLDNTRIETFNGTVVGYGRGIVEIMLHNGSIKAVAERFVYELVDEQPGDVQQYANLAAQQEINRLTTRNAALELQLEVYSRLKPIGWLRPSELAYDHWFRINLFSAKDRSATVQAFILPEVEQAVQDKPLAYSSTSG